MFMNIGCLHTLRAIFLIIFGWLDVVIKQLVFLSAFRWKSARRGKPCKVFRNSIEGKSHEFFFFFFFLVYDSPYLSLICFVDIMHFSFIWIMPNLLDAANCALGFGLPRMRRSVPSSWCSRSVDITLLAG
jgi:hypothetical protein